MKTLRALRKLLLLALGTLGFYLMWQAGRGFYALARRRAHKWRTWNFRSWSRTMARIMRMKIEVRGRPPQAPFFLVTNHLSYLDILLLAAQLDCLFVSRSDVGSWPVVGHLVSSMKTIYIDRARRKDVVRVHRLLDEALADGEGIVIFPEGTSSAGAHVLPFKPSLLELAVQRQQPVSYACISYRTPAQEAPAHLAVCWWADMTFGEHLFNLLKLSGFQASLVFGEEAVLERDRKALAEKLHVLVSKQFTPVVGMEELCHTAKV